MKKISVNGLSSALCLVAVAATAQETSEIEQIRRQLQEANEAFRKAMEQYQKSTEALNKRLEQIQGKGVAGQTTGTASATNAVGNATNTTGATVSMAAGVGAKPWSPADPIRLAGNTQNYLNLSFDGLFA